MADEHLDAASLLDKLEELVHAAKPVPLTDQVRIDRAEFYDLIDRIRVAVRAELDEARRDSGLEA
jgi:hypothetical protein